MPITCPNGHWELVISLGLLRKVSMHGFHQMTTSVRNAQVPLIMQRPGGDTLRIRSKCSLLSTGVNMPPREHSAATLSSTNTSRRRTSSATSGWLTPGRNCGGNGGKSCAKFSGRCVMRCNAKIRLLTSCASMRSRRMPQGKPASGCQIRSRLPTQMHILSMSWNRGRNDAYSVPFMMLSTRGLRLRRPPHASRLVILMEAVVAHLAMNEVVHSAPPHASPVERRDIKPRIVLMLTKTSAVA